MIVTIKLTQDSRCTPGMRAAIVFLLPASLPPSPSFLARFFLFPRILFSLFCRTEQTERSPGNSFTSRSRGDRPSARARWLPPKGRPNRPDWRDRTSIFHCARLRITCPCAPHANESFASPRTSWARRLENYMPRDVWILRSAQFLALPISRDRDRESFSRLIYYSKRFLKELEIFTSWFRSDEMTVHMTF